MTRRISQTIVFLLCAQALCAGPASGASEEAPDGTGAIFSAVPLRCPFNFRDGMPPGVFCVYDGIVIGSDGEACGDRELLIWSRLAPEFNPGDPHDAGVSDRSEVYFGFVTAPDLVLRATVVADAESHAPIISYTLGDHQPRLRLRGIVERRLVPTGGRDDTEVLSFHVDRPLSAAGACALTSYEGTFVAVMTLPSGAIR